MNLTDALRPWATKPEVNRELRAMLRAVDGPAACVVLLPGAIPPEVVPAWRTVDGRPVAAVKLQVARELAMGRSPTAAEALDAAPPAGGCWCLALGPDGSAVTWSTPVIFSGRTGAPIGDA